MSASPLGVALVGHGYWGPNLLRNYMALPGTAVKWVCDVRPEALKKAQTRYASVPVTTAYDQVLADPAGFASARGWFAFLPCITAAELRNEAGDAFDVAVDVAGGTAVRTMPITLVAARAALAPLMAPAPNAALAPPADITGVWDVTLYPVVD